MCNLHCRSSPRRSSSEMLALRRSAPRARRFSPMARLASPLRAGRHLQADASTDSCGCTLVSTRLTSAAAFSRRSARVAMRRRRHAISARASATPVLCWRPNKNAAGRLGQAAFVFVVEKTSASCLPASWLSPCPRTSPSSSFSSQPLSFNLPRHWDGLTLCCDSPNCKRAMRTSRRRQSIQ
jgi:hypothetical protein